MSNPTLLHAERDATTRHLAFPPNTLMRGCHVSAKCLARVETFRAVRHVADEAALRVDILQMPRQALPLPKAAFTAILAARMAPPFVDLGHVPAERRLLSKDLVAAIGAAEEAQLLVNAVDVRVEFRAPSKRAVATIPRACKVPLGGGSRRCHCCGVAAMARVDGCVDCFAARQAMREKDATPV